MSIYHCVSKPSGPVLSLINQENIYIVFHLQMNNICAFFSHHFTSHILYILHGLNEAFPSNYNHSPEHQDIKQKNKQYSISLKHLVHLFILFVFFSTWFFISFFFFGNKPDWLWNSWRQSVRYISTWSVVLVRKHDCLFYRQLSQHLFTWLNTAVRRHIQTLDSLFFLK